jgi:hypothetical protein
VLLAPCQGYSDSQLECFSSGKLRIAELLIFTLEQMYGIVDMQNVVGSEQVGRYTAGINKPGGFFFAIFWKHRRFAVSLHEEVVPRRIRGFQQ